MSSKERTITKNYEQIYRFVFLLIPVEQFHKLSIVFLRVEERFFFEFMLF